MVAVRKGDGGGSNLGFTGGKGGSGNDTGGLLLEQWDLKVRYYKLTTSDVILLGSLGAAGSILFTIGGGLLGIYINLEMSSAFATLPLSPEAIVYKNTWGPFSFYGGLVCCGLGVLTGIASFARFLFIRFSHVKRSGDATI